MNNPFDSNHPNPFDAPDQEYANPYEPAGGTHKQGKQKSTYGQLPTSDVTPLVPLQTVSLSSSPYAHVGHGQIDPVDSESRESSLQARELAVAEKERQLRIREENLGVAPRAPNWPFACYPITYHSIQDEIPLHHQKLVKQFYYAMLVTWVCLIWNWVTMLTIWGQSSDGSSDVVYSTIYIVLGIPGSWVLWYKQIYLGCRDSRSIKFAAFFCNFSIHIAFCVIMGLGIPLVAGGGLLVVIKTLAHGYTLSCVFAFFDMIAYLLLSFFCVYLIKKAHAVWKSGGGEQQMQQDVAGFAINNAHHIQHATTTV